MINTIGYPGYYTYTRVRVIWTFFGNPTAPPPPPNPRICQIMAIFLKDIWNRTKSYVRSILWKSLIAISYWSHLPRKLCWLDSHMLLLMIYFSFIFRFFMLLVVMMRRRFWGGHKKISKTSTFNSNNVNGSTILFAKRLNNSCIYTCIIKAIIWRLILNM